MMELNLRSRRCRNVVLVGVMLLDLCGVTLLHAAAVFSLAGDWKVKVQVNGQADQVVTVDPPVWVMVHHERIASLPVFNPQAGGWVRGVQLIGVRAQETTTPFLLDPDSVQVKDGADASAVVYKRGVDYELDPIWGTLGRKLGGALPEGKAVSVSYRHAQLRLDAVVLEEGGRVVVRRGTPMAAAPSPPELKSSDTRLGHVWIPGRLERLGEEHLFPILETAYPEKPKVLPTMAERWIPRTLSKLRAGGKVKILAWGDSVTVGTYVPHPETERWQAQFVSRLQQRFPRAQLELVTEAWGGRNTTSYLKEPPGSEHNYREKVLAVKPDLVVSEFVNDAGLNPAQVQEQYGRLLKDFREIGAEWIILTPHYVRPDWMGLNRERDIDDDPRPYVAGLRDFSVKNEVALADASLRYGRLWRQGIPYTTLMLNSINHPDARGMKIFADALMELFP